MANINSMTQPVAEVNPSVTAEIEKQLANENIDVHDDEKPQISDEDLNKQDGVKRVEAITTVWNNQVLIVMFVL